jgi:uncharacterized protein YcbK (DUF882 family)
MRLASEARHALTGFGTRAAIVLAAGVFELLGLAGGTHTARAGDDTRSLTLFHTHTGERATITFWRDGQYDDEALGQLNWFLRDWRVNEPAKMDPELFNVLWEVYRESGSREPINIISAYRSPPTNAMLRHRSKAVSEHSQHMLGKAMDIRLPDVDTARLRGIAMRMQYGGVGYYQSSRFVHVDTGSVRAWPRMSEEQLVRLFPDGKTVHLPPSGKPLPRYEEAQAEILARKQILASAAGGGDPLTGLFKKLFGRGSGPGGVQPEPAAIMTASLPSEESSGAAAIPTAPLPPRRPGDGPPVRLGEAPQQEGTPSLNNSLELSDEHLTATSRLLFSTTPLESQPSSRLTSAEEFGSQLLPRAYLTASSAPLMPQTFGGTLNTVAREQGFTGPASSPVPIWRVARAEPLDDTSPR